MEYNRALVIVKFLQKVIIMLILGIDPGYGITGYGAIELKEGKLSLLEYGIVTTPAKIPFCERLSLIYEKMTKIIEKIKPDVMVIEKLFFKNNQKTAIDVAQARGVILLCGKNSEVQIEEFTPLQVKMIITGYGRAKKNQIMGTVKNILELSDVPKPDDAADAVALAICYAKKIVESNGVNTT